MNQKGKINCDIKKPPLKKGTFVTILGFNEWTDDLIVQTDNGEKCIVHYSCVNEIRERKVGKLSKTNELPIVIDRPATLEEYAETYGIKPEKLRRAIKKLGKLRKVKYGK